ncbi:MAG: (Fe-S)-binding protein, partial [Candidatus Ranarchaeia archaeon]
LVQEHKNPEVVFFVGCVYSYDPKLMQVAADTVKLLDAAHVSFVVLGDREVCCGAPYFLNGLGEKGKKFAKKNMETINKFNPKYVITGCPACFRNLRFEYPELGYALDAKVLHTTELLDQLLWERRLKLNKKLQKTVSYHDPCELGRLSGLYRPARRILERIPGLKFVEIPEYNMDRGRCCGGGGGVKAVYPQLADRMAEIRLWDIEEAKMNIDFLVSACPQCEANLGAAAKRMDTGYEVIDIASLMVRSLEEK